MTEPSQKIKIIEIPADNKSTEFKSGRHIYVRESFGFYQKLRRFWGWVLAFLFVLVPWLSYDGQQAIWIDLASQQFHFFGTTLYPQDLPILATLLMVAAFALFFITTFLGRVWCGYLCPQTVWTLLFVWFEQRLEGTASQRKKQDSRTFTAQLWFRKILKHLAWLIIAFLTSTTFISYFVPPLTLYLDLFTFQASGLVWFWVALFWVCTYGNAGWMRSIMCTHMCPYARFQSAMFDKDTYVIAYDQNRGEPRGPRSRKVAENENNLGSCIDCKLCVQVCPMGIDIRDGLQYECISCGACIDVCNQTMKQMGYQPNLIQYTTEREQIGQKTKLLRPRLLGYGLVMCVMLVGMLYQISQVSPVELSVLRDRQQLYRINTQEEVENTYTLKVLNKTSQTQSYEIGLSAQGLTSTDFSWYGQHHFSIPSGESHTQILALGLSQERMSTNVLTLQFSLHSQGKEIQTATSTFMGPKP